MRRDSRWDAGQVFATGVRKLPAAVRRTDSFTPWPAVENVVMVRAMRAMGVDYAEYLQRFGFPAQNIVHTESLALSGSAFTPMQVARGYAR